MIIICSKVNSWNKIVQPKSPWYFAFEWQVIISLSFGLNTLTLLVEWTLPNQEVPEFQRGPT